MKRKEDLFDFLCCLVKYYQKQTNKQKDSTENLSRKAESLQLSLLLTWIGVVQKEQEEGPLSLS